jgi:hypothetical protein
LAGKTTASKKKRQQEEEEEEENWDLRICGHVRVGTNVTIKGMLLVGVSFFSSLPSLSLPGPGPRPRPQPSPGPGTGPSLHRSRPALPLPPLLLSPPSLFLSLLLKFSGNRNSDLKG